MKIAIPIVIALALGTAGCGFHPLFARTDTNAGGQQAFNSIFVDPVGGGRVAYELRDSLIDLLRGASHPDQALYRLKVTIKQSVEATAVQTTGEITRYTYTMTADYVLTNAHTGAEITKGTEATFSGYDVLASPYATLVAQQDAQRSGANAIAGRIRIDLGVYFAGHGTAK